MKKLLIIAAFLFAAAGEVCAQTGNQSVPGGSSSSASPGIVNPSSTAFAGGAKFSTHFVADPTFTNTSNVVSAPDANLTGTDSQGRAMAKVGQIVFGTNATTDVSQTTSITITPECVIQSIDSGTQLHMGTIGAPGTPCNATASTSASGYLIWGDLDTASSTQTQSAANDPYYAAWQQVINNCGTAYVLPGGASLVERGEWDNGPAVGCNAGPYVQLTRQGFTMYGQGPASTILIMTPNFVAADCSPGCFGGGIVNPNVQDFQIAGFGNSTPGAAFNNKSIFYAKGDTTNFGSNFSFRHVIFQGFGAQVTGSIGLDIGHNVASSVSGGLISDSIFEAIGAVAVMNQPGNVIEMTEVTNTQFTGCGIGVTVGSTAAGCVGVKQGQWSSSNSFYGWSPTSFTSENGVVCTGASTICKFDGDYLPYQSGTGTAQLTADTGATVRLSQTFINNPTASSFGVSYGSTVTGATIYASESTLTAATAADGIVCLGASTLGTFINLGGNVAGGLTSTCTAFKSFASSSEAGTVTCATSAATITFKGSYVNNPLVVIQDQTTAGAVTQTSLSTTTKVVGCPGASDVLLYTVTPNPI